MINTALAFALFISWSLFLLILMEALRTKLVATKQIAANKFMPENENLSPFMQRLARAHLNCVESLPVFGGLMLLAIATSRASITDPLAIWFVAARGVQSCVHLISGSVIAVNIRFTAFAIQMIIGTIWAWKLLVALA